MKLKKRQIFKTVWFSLAAVFVVWNWSTFQSRNLPKETFANNAMVEVVESKDRITFKSRKPEQTVELIFFPGGLADSEAYAPLCRAIAENGYTCHIIKMAFRLPQHDYQKILQMFDLKSGHYVIGGHLQFGYLGGLLMDDKADITLEEQQSIVLESLVNFLNEITDDKGKGI